MSQAETPNYPIIEGLAATAPCVESDPRIWDEAHKEAQHVLGELERDVLCVVGDVEIKSGRTAGKTFVLFTYKKFSIPGSRLDPVIAGITFVPIGSRIEIEGDISGEQTGDVHIVLPKKIVEGTSEQLIGATRELAISLKQSAAVIVEALRDQSRLIDSE